MIRKIRAFWRKPAAGIVHGHVDNIQNGVVYGWAFAPLALHKRLLIDIFVDGVFAGEVIANQLREDLRLGQIGDGRHAFSFDLKRGPFNPDTCVIAAYALDEKPVLLASSLPPMQQASRALPWQDAPSSPRDYACALFAGAQPLLPTPRASPEHGARADEPGSFHERLFAPSPLGRAVAGGYRLGSYLDLVRRRLEMSVRYDPELGEGQYAAYLRAYLEDYGSRRGPLRAPLGASDIAFLNAPPSQALLAQRASCAASRAQWLFEPRFAPPALAGMEGRCFAFAQEVSWCAYDCITLSVEDCLVNAEADGFLRKLDADQEGAPWPLTPFMRTILANHPILRALPLDGTSPETYCVFLLLAETTPHWLNFAPPTALAAFLQPGHERQSPFAATCQAYLGASGREARQRAMLAAQLFDPDSLSFATHRPGAGRVWGASQPIAQDKPVCVQLIGPFSRALGIGQSCRRLAAALKLTPFSLRCCDFTLDHPNAAHAGPDLNLEAPGRTRINILHLNLEDVAAAVAYLPDIFSGAYTIVLPYLELTPASDLQRIGAGFADEIFAASRFIAEVLAPLTPVTFVGASCPSAQPMGRLRARAHAYPDMAGASDFVFLTAGDALSGVYRKNPLGVVKAFRDAFPDRDDVRLIIKTHSLALMGAPPEQAVWKMIENVCAEDARIMLVNRLLDGPTQSALVEGADCLVSLHRAEGLGYHLMEAMALGTPVIAVDYSGTVDFCDETTAALVSWRPVHVEAGQYPRASAAQVWAEPDHATAVAQMRRIYADRSWSQRLAAEAERRIRQDYSTQAFAARLEARLAQILRQLNC